MSNLIDTTEMYLRTILELEEEGVPALRARIAERLDHSGPTVSQTVARMERDGLLTVLPNRNIELSAEGRERATKVMRKHRIAERLLTDVIGLELEYVHDEACRWEHVMSDRVEEKILALLSDHSRSPYGNPIPGLEGLGAPQTETQPVVRRMGTVADGDEVVLASIGEPLQAEPEILAQMAEAGVVPGATLIARREGTGVVMYGVDKGPETAVWLDDELADFLFVESGDTVAGKVRDASGSG